MNQNFHAIIIGFNKFADQLSLPALEFAEKDARDLYETLIDPRYGNCPEENIHLITGNATKDEVETALYQHAVHERGQQDTVLIYYSGHGFIAGDTPESYLATPDTDVNKINTNPNAGLPMEYLRKKIFLASPAKRAKNMIFILDCCFSGSFCPDDVKGGYDDRPKTLVESHDFDSDGRVAFVSSPARMVSRESKKFKNGIFTYWLNKGIQGEAVEQHEGENKGDVTMSSLISYVQSMCSGMQPPQPPISYGKSPRIVIARPQMKPSTHEEFFPKTDNGFIHPLIRSESVFAPLINPIEKQVDFIDNLLQHLQKIEITENTVILGNQILNSIRDALGADFALVEQIDNSDDHRHKFTTDSLSASIDSQDCATQVWNEISPMATQNEAKFLLSPFGFCIQSENTKGKLGFTIAVPLRLEYPREFLIVSGIKEAALESEILGHTLLSLYRATLKFSSLDLTKAETYLLDNIKRSFGRVPYKFYERRFSKFKELLNQVTFAFEPIVYLGRKKVEIDSWEALARDPVTNSAPSDLFRAAELWGPKFLTELDIYCLENAVQQYCERWASERKNEKMDPLSVNVYPETLLRREYEEKLHHLIIEEELIKGKKLVLEISEKRPLSWIDQLNEKFVSDPTGVFSKQLQELSKSFGIGFAIDDFGVGHASADRLARLELDHVKIDRDILHHHQPIPTIKYVLDILQSIHTHPIKVVIEGFDDESSISLADIYNLGIEYIQGYEIRKASCTVADLELGTKEHLLRIINGQKDDISTQKKLSEESSVTKPINNSLEPYCSPTLNYAHK